MEGDYYDYEKNLSRSFDDSERNTRHSTEPRKRQRLDDTNISTVLKGSPLSTNTPSASVSAKGRSAFHDNFYADEDDVSPSQAYPHPHNHYPHPYHSPERVAAGAYPYYPDPPYKSHPLPHYGEHNAPSSHLPNSPADMTNGNAARQPYSYENHSFHQYASAQWEPYSYHSYQQPFHPSLQWNNYSPRYRHQSNDGESPNNERTPDFFPHPVAPPYPPYYFPNYPVHYPYPQHDPNYAKDPPSNSHYPAPDGMPSHHMEEMPIQRTMPLFMAIDEETLSEYQCLARKQIEVFSATYKELKMTVQGRNRQIFPGQVGIRCRFCAHIPVKQQARASVYYPSKLECLYQSAQNMTSVHLAKHCRFVPEDIRNELLRLMKDRKSSAGGGKEYWAVSARSLGIEECDGRLRFAAQTNDDSARAG